MYSYLRDTLRLTAQYISAGLSFLIVGILFICLKEMAWSPKWLQTALFLLGFVLAHFAWEFTGRWLRSETKAKPITRSAADSLFLEAVSSHERATHSGLMASSSPALAIGLVVFCSTGGARIQLQELIGKHSSAGAAGAISPVPPQDIAAAS